MQTNINDYDTRPSWTPAQNQRYSSQYATPYDGRQPLQRPQYPVQAQYPVNQKPKAPAKMPKDRAMALANKFKRGLAIASIVGFGAFGGLAALHQVGTTATQSTSGSSSSNSTNSSSSSSQSSNNFLNQQGGNANGTSSSSTSTPTTSSSSSSTVTGTHSS